MADFEYQLDGELIVVPVYLAGKSGVYDGMFIWDTGSSSIIIDHSVAYAIGYSARDGIGFSTVASAAGKEKGYRLVVKKLEVLDKKLNDVEVRCHDLKDQGVEGLIGMSFLKQFKWCLDPRKQTISTAS